MSRYEQARENIDALMSGDQFNAYPRTVMTDDGPADVVAKVYPAGSTAEMYPYDTEFDQVLGVAYYHDSGFVVVERHFQNTGDYRSLSHGHGFTGKCMTLHDEEGNPAIEQYTGHAPRLISKYMFGGYVLSAVDELAETSAAYDILRPENPYAAESRKLALLMEDGNTDGHMRPYEGLFHNQALRRALSLYVEP